METIATIGVFLLHLIGFVMLLLSLLIAAESEQRRTV